MTQPYINPDLLIAAPMLQDLLVDKNGIPMTAGTITCYQDNSRTTLKNWYYQSSNSPDSQGNYTFSRLPNPLTLSAAGTICDVNGVDTIPFWYPYSELDETVSQPYYVTIVSFDQTTQITRPNFPYNRESNEPVVIGTALNNLIVNNGFWRNIQPNYANTASPQSITLNTILKQQIPFATWSTPFGTASNLYSTTVSPSQHDGHYMPDMQFIKNNTSATDTVTFTAFPLSTQLLIANTTTPEYYLNHLCSAAGSSETVKCYQFPLDFHLNNVASFPYTMSIQAMNNGGTNPVIQLQILQFTGSGTTSPTPTVIGNTTINLSSTWTTYTFTGIFPSTAGLTLSAAEDDGWYLQIQLPLNSTCNINFTKPSLYLTDNVIPMNDLMTYDQVNAIISNPRTGDVRFSINSFYNWGWVPMNDGVICQANPNTSLFVTRANPDVWPLYNLIWNYAVTYDSGSNFNPIAQMYTSATSPTATNYGANALADFTANKQIALTQSLGDVIMGTVPVSALLNVFNQSVTISNSAGKILCTVSTAPYTFFIGQPVTFTASGSLPGNIVANAVYYVANPNAGAGTFNVSTSFANAIAGTTINYSSTGSGVKAIFQTMGANIGEYQHTLTTGEMPAHVHPPLSPSTTFVGIQGGTGNGTQSPQTGTPLKVDSPTTGVMGNGFSHNNIQFSTLYNVYMKL